jgi:hypothetical protein
MIVPTWSPRRLYALDDAQIEQLADVLIDCVEGGAAARLYQRLGWVRVGEIPGYALFPRGGLCATTVYYRTLAD